jgi:gliding motility-associated-like protein
LDRKFLHIILIIFLFVGSHYTNAQHTLVNTNVKFNVPAGVYVRVPGDVINNTNSTINNNGNIFLSGDFINNATVVSGNNSNVKLEGAVQNIGGTNITTFGNLIIDGTNDKTISIQSRVSNTLIFNANHVIIGNNNMVLLQNAGTFGAFNNKYVVTNGTGSLVKKSLPLSSSFLFPVGDALSSYKPVTLDYTGVTDTFAVRVEAGVNPTTGTDLSCVQYTYVVEESINGGTSASMSLGWNSPDEGASFIRPQTLMWQYNGAWTQLAGVQGAISNLPATDWYYQTTGITDFSSAANRFILRTAEQLTIIIPPDDSAICSGTDALFTVTAIGTAPISYQWQSNCGAGWVDLTNGGVYSGVNTDSLIISGAGTGLDSCLFQCIVSNATTADTSDPAMLIVDPNLPVSVNIAVAPSATICSGTNVTFNAAAVNGGSSPTYQWQLNGLNVGTNSTTYSNNALSDGDQVSCILISSANCASGPDTSIVTMIVNVPPVAFISSPVSFCQGDSALLVSSSTGVTYQWLLNGADILDAVDSIYYASQPGNYSVVVSNNCASDTSLIVSATQMPLPTALISPNGTVGICQGSSAVLSSNTGSGYTYQWQMNGTDISGAIDSTYTAMVPGTYNVVVTNNCGSVSSLMVTVIVVFPPTAVAIPTGPTNFCSGESVTLVANPDSTITYQWQMNGSDINGATSSTYTTSLPGDYSLVTSNDCGSDTSALIIVNIYLSPAVDAGDSVHIIAGESTTLSALATDGTGPYTYTWYPALSLDNPTSSDPLASPFETTTYTVIVTDANGCTSADTVTVYVDYEIDIYLPTGFSPNGDDENDILFVRGHGIKYLELIIYDRWGEKVFETTSQDNGWDGTYKGKPLDPAVFVYYLNVLFYNNEVYTKQGNITLVK